MKKAERTSDTRIFRILTALFICFLGMLLLTSCGEKKETGPTTIRFVTWKPNQPAAWEELFRIFHQENPDIIVQPETGPHSSTAFHDLLTQKLKNRSTDADVFLMDVIWTAEFAAAGWAEPLDQFMPQAEKERFIPGTILANTHDGILYGIPLFIDSGVLFYRNDLLQKYGFHPPRTWDELVHQARTITAGEAADGREMYGFSGQFKQYEGLVCNMMEYLLGNGGNILSSASGKAAIAEEPSLAAVRFVRDSIIGGIAPKGVLTYQEPESLALFIQNRAVFLRSWPYAWEIANDPARSQIAGKVALAKLPHFAGGKSYATLGGWQVGISAFSRKKEAAWKFAQFLGSERTQKILALRAGRAPTRTDLYADAEILAANPHFSDMKEVFLSAYPRPRSPLYPALSNILQRYFSKAISDRHSDIRREALEAAGEINRLISLTP